MLDKDVSINSVVNLAYRAFFVFTKSLEKDS